MEFYFIFNLFLTDYKLLNYLKYITIDKYERQWTKALFSSFQGLKGNNVSKRCIG